MEQREINEKYLRLLKRYGVSACITVQNSPTAPSFSVADEEATPRIVLNEARLTSGDYERTLAYCAEKLLLPRLVLETDRLVLRRFRQSDAADCFKLLSDEQGSYMDCSKHFSEQNGEFAELVELYVERETQFAVTLKESGEVIGTVRLFSDDTRAVEARELGYSIAPAHQRRGYAYEALKALMKLLDELKVELVLAGVLEENIPSARLLEKLGFKKEGLRRKAIWHEALNAPVDLIYYYCDEN